MRQYVSLTLGQLPVQDRDDDLSQIDHAKTSIRLRCRDQRLQNCPCACASDKSVPYAFRGPPLPSAMLPHSVTQ